MLNVVADSVQPILVFIRLWLRLADVVHPHKDCLIMRSPASRANVLWAAFDYVRVIDVPAAFAEQ